MNTLDPDLNMSYKEISQRLGLSERTIRNTEAVALAKLRQLGVDTEKLERRIISRHNAKGRT